MTTLDLDDLPPLAAALLSGLQAGEEVVLVQHGLVVAKLTAAPEPVAPAPDPVAPDQQVREVFEHFRASIEDEF